MKLSKILKSVELLKTVGSLDVEVFGLELNSSKITQGDAFVALRGANVDGHNYITSAIENGASVIICEAIPENVNDNVTYVQLSDTSASVGDIATEFFGNPSSRLKLIGVTGTNGKTTIATLLFKLFRKLGYGCGLCSTVCNYINEEAFPTKNTTPDAITLNRLLSQMVEAGCEYAFMEVSSHAVVQHRIKGLNFAGGIFTNLTRDHLDFHNTFENYRDAKKAFFDSLDKQAFVITNLDDRNGTVMVQNCKAEMKTYSQQRMADFRAKVLEMTFQGMLLEINGVEVHVPLVGKFNVSNLLAIYSTAIMLGQDKQQVLIAMSMLYPVFGRFETLQSPLGTTAIIDYAHTPDALANVLVTIREVLNGAGQVITVCGAGGNRDKGKRPLMAKEASLYSDKVILTSDNPRFENPSEIIQEMLKGVPAEKVGNVIVIEDRRQAIRTAMMFAGKNDVVLVAGKGHEDYQEIKGVKHHFDDKEEVLATFELVKR